jgi:RNA polymerase sigma factor (sigma-70 family)
LQDEIEELIEHNIGLVRKQLNKFYLANNPDAISLAYEALWKAATTFKHEKGVKFSTYATVCIFNTLGSFVRTLHKQRQLELVSYNAIIDGKDTEYLDLLPAPINIEESYLRNEHLNKVGKLFESEFGWFNNKQQAILVLWRDSDFSATTSEIALEVGCSQSYASQVINIMKGRLKNRLEESN